MFREPKQFNEAQLRAIREVGETQGGQFLAEYIRQEVEAYVQGILHAPAEDANAVAYMQAGVRLGEKLYKLLQDDILKILDEHNITPEGPDAG